MSPSRPIRLIDAVRFFKGESHQIAAWEWLNENLSTEQKEEFGLLYRSGPSTQPTLRCEATWESVLQCAERAGAKYPELVAAQFWVESGGGRHMPPGSNNPFGLKGTGVKSGTKEFLNGRWVDTSAEFLTFPNLATAVVYLVERWYLDYKTFRGCNNAKNRDAAADWLQKQGYATDPRYSELLKQAMRQYAPVSELSINVQNPLRVPYFSQRDSAVPGQAMRMCFSSSCAMLAAFLRPGDLHGSNADDQFLRVVNQYGDTTDATAQLRALRHYGIKAEFTQNCDWAQVEAQLKRGIPVPMGILHKGSVSAPAGGGHWICAIGFTGSGNKGSLIVHDPFGELDLVRGGYLSHRGNGLVYSRKNLGPRFMVEGERSGWAIIASL